MSASAIYRGWVTHARQRPVRHSFRYRVFLPLFDLDELPDLLDRVPLWSARRPAPARFRRADHIGDTHIPLADCARDLVGERMGRRPRGRVELLANPRYFGVGFNPVSFYFLYDREPERLAAVIADVTSTPWGERHAYVAPAIAGEVSHRFEKEMHVSPFMGMEQTYRLEARAPAEGLELSITSDEGGAPIFGAGLSLHRSPLSRSRLAGMLATYPPMTLATLARIYGNALRLKIKGAPYHRRPEAAR